jgi:hypothetical protein
MIQITVIGAGGAGLLAAIAAARSGLQTVLFERKSRPGRKVAISGGGRCNFTNSLPPREFVRRFGDPNAGKLGRALQAFSNDDLIALLARHGIHGRVEKDYRLYTTSGRGSDVVEALAAEARDAGAEIRTAAPVAELRPVTGGWELRFDTPSPTVVSRAVIVCTGGLSYPKTGSTGDGFRWARELGHQVSPLQPALVGLTLAEDWPARLSGTAIDDAQLCLWPTNDKPAKKPVATERQELLFTHFGISGPAVLDISNAYVRSGQSRARLTIDFAPTLPREELDAELRRRFDAAPRRSITKALEGGLLPNRLLQAFAHSIHGDAPTVAGQLTREQRSAWVAAIKQTELTITGTRGIDHGEVTVGGVTWSEIDPATLMSRLHPGLFFAGEVLDIAGRCGGFNLQAAFSTGFLAGREAASYVRTQQT